MELPVAVDPEQVPPSVRSGSVVDVYLLGGRDGSRGGPTSPVIAEATVVDAPSIEVGFASPTGRRQLVLAVPEADVAAFFDALARVDEPVLTVVRRG